MPPPSDPFVEEVRSHMAAEVRKDENGLRNLFILVLSIVVFAGLGLVRWSVSGVILIVAALLVHETGHLIGMKFFNYRDVRMLFIPFFGAAVSGKDVSNNMTARAVVALCGPVAGISAGILAGMLHSLIDMPILLEAARMSLIISLINLLPLHPLDGAILLDAALFVRYPRAELVFKIGTTILLGILAILAKDIVLGVFAFIVFMSLYLTYIVATVSRKVRDETRRNAGAAEDGQCEPSLERIVLHLHKTLPADSKKSAKVYATYARLVTERMRSTPCTAGMTVTLVGIYLLTAFFGVAAFAAFSRTGDTDGGSAVSTEHRALSDSRNAEVQTECPPSHPLPPGSCGPWRIEAPTVPSLLRHPEGNQNRPV